MLKIEATLKGFDNLDKVLRKLPDMVQKKLLTQTANAGAKVLKDETVNLAPKSRRNKIHLKDEINAIKDKGFGRYLVTSGRAYWGTFQEYGTSKQAAQPFMRPAIANSQEKMLRKQADTLAKALLRETKKVVK